MINFFFLISIYKNILQHTDQQGFHKLAEIVKWQMCI